MGKTIAVLDLGTSKSTAFVVQKDYPGSKLTILRTETLPSKGAIRRGRVYNLDETSGIISKLIRKLNSSPDTMKVEKIYVGIGGQSLHTQLFTVKRMIQGEVVKQELIESMEEEAKKYMPDFEDNLGISSCEYYADGQLVANPKGTAASVIEAHFQLITGNPCLKRNLENLFNKNDISVAGYFISPLATAEAVLTSEEKESGCALVEFGEGVTYISIYKHKALKYLITLPIGGLAITKDIRSLNVSESEAETLKIEQGSAIPDLSDSGAVSVSERHSSPRNIELKDLNWIIEARVDEIIRNVWSQIQASGYAQALGAGIVITGGGALLRNLPQYIRNQTEKEVRLADARMWINRPESLLSPADSCVIGLALLGKDNCVEEKVLTPPIQQIPIFPEGEIEEVPKPPKEQVEKTSSIFRRMGKKLKDTFNEGANLFQEEEDNNNNNATNKQ